MLLQLLSFLGIVLAVPLGLWLAWLARDEIMYGRKWFRFIVITSLIGAYAGFLIGRLEITLSCVFIALVSLISLAKSQDKNWAKKRFK